MGIVLRASPVNTEDKGHQWLCPPCPFGIPSAQTSDAPGVPGYCLCGQMVPMCQDGGPRHRFLS